MTQANDREDHSRNDHRTGPTDNRSMFRFDGTIPAWGLFTLLFTVGMMWATYSWSQVQDLKDRMTAREISSAEYRKKVDLLETRQIEMQSFRSDLLVMREIMNRIEKKLDQR